MNKTKVEIYYVPKSSKSPIDGLCLVGRYKEDYYLLFYYNKKTLKKELIVKRYEFTKLARIYNLTWEGSL